MNFRRYNKNIKEGKQSERVENDRQIYLYQNYQGDKKNQSQRRNRHSQKKLKELSIFTEEEFQTETPSIVSGKTKKQTYLNINIDMNLPVRNKSDLNKNNSQQQQIQEYLLQQNASRSIVKIQSQENGLFVSCQKYKFSKNLGLVSDLKSAKKASNKQNQKIEKTQIGSIIQKKVLPSLRQKIENRLKSSHSNLNLNISNISNRNQREKEITRHNKRDLKPNKDRQQINDQNKVNVKFSQALKNYSPFKQMKNTNDYARKQGRKISNKNQQILQKSQKFNKLSFQQRQYQILSRKEAKVERLRTQKQNIMYQQCSFIPRLNKPKNKENTRSIIMR